MWYLCCAYCKTIDDARKEAMKIGRENFVSIHKEKRKLYAVLYWRWVDAELFLKLRDI